MCTGDFIQVLLTVDGLKRELLCTVSDGFGLRLADAHNLKGEGLQVQASGSAVSCEPIEGGPGAVQNVEQLKQAIVVMRRGKITFADKVCPCKGGRERGPCVVIRG